MIKCETDKILQVLIGSVFIASGILKGIDPYGTALKIEEYAKAFSIYLSENSFMVLSVFLCGFEVFIGVMLLSFLYRKLFAILALIVLGLFSIMMLYFVISPSSIVEDCGCFGEILPMSLPLGIAKNVLMIGVVIVILYLISKGSVKYKQIKGFISVALALILSVCIPVYSAVRLPFVEFTEYKIGADLHNVKSFQLVDGEYSNVTDKVLDTEHQILIIKKRKFTDDELRIIENFTQQVSKGLYNVDVVIGVSSDNSKNELYCSENTLKMIARTPENAAVFLEKGIIRNKKKLGSIPNNIKH